MNVDKMKQLIEKQIETWTRLVNDFPQNPCFANSLQELRQELANHVNQISVKQ